ncbi:clustered mitochondria-domain-containing protein [Sphaerosporella brunnea]|uniref:Clustered mitochondria protein homolog n=1 Tax=Sphaerosporella brunnea TaxID=1250544 RepID=A0A5J5EXP2_9PEZI|nr:clustered mitochondria-domain-containing protein [Sphaerosporella brunnea]
MAEQQETPNVDSTVEVRNEAQNEDAVAEPAVQDLFQLTVKLPHPPHRIQIMVSIQEQVQDIRQSIIELPGTYQYSCFHLEHNGVRVNDYVELSEVPGIGPDAKLILVEDPYTEKEARIHLLRTRELIGAASVRNDTVSGVAAGITLFDGVDTVCEKAPHPLSNYDFNAPGSLEQFLPVASNTTAPKCVRGLCLSPWNPPPHHLRQKGHLLYIQCATLEGEQVHITSHVSGFYVNNSNSNKFDPSPRTKPKMLSAHSLVTLLGMISPSFEKEFQALQEFNSTKDPLITFGPTNAIPASPWLVPGPDAQHKSHTADLARPQEQYLIAGAEGVDSLRDFNEEFQSTRELPRETVQERVFRERLLSKLFADYTDAAVRGAMLIAKGEIAPLNPTEGRDAQIYVYNNIFFSHGADGVGTFTSEGGDEAARVATGKDVMGVKTVNSLDIPGLQTPGTVVVDYLGRRLVAQSIVPGIFRQREEGQSQIDYGGVEGKDVVATNDEFASLFDKMSKALRVKAHPVWDKDNKRHDLVSSVETKGLLGTDGRKYVLDLYRITPLDVDFIEKHWKGVEDETGYPHKMAVLRQELVEAFWKLKMREYISGVIKQRQEARKEAEKEKAEKAEGKQEAEGEEKKDEEKEEEEPQEDRVDISGFDFALNPDVFSGQVPQTEEEKAQWEADEKDVRDACTFLVEKCIPGLIEDLKEGEVGSPMDGYSLTRLMHKRGINIRYLGSLATLATEQGSRLASIKILAVQEMIARVSKHILNSLLRGLPLPLVPYAVSHFLNCLLGATHNPNPEVAKDEALWKLYHDADFTFEKLTVDNLRAQVQKEVQRRYRYDLEEDWASKLKPLQMLREVALKLGLQLQIKDYEFGPAKLDTGKADAAKVNGAAPTTNGSSSGKGKHKKKGSANSGASSPVPKGPSHTFSPEDVMNIFPIVKDSSSKSQLAEEALEAGRISIIQNQKELGQELLLESLSLHEQIYGVLHPEVARVYNTLSMLYYQLDEKPAAVELARKAVIVSERTLGVDSAETILNYLNLGLFEHANGDTKAALAYIKHAFGFWRIIYGDGHPDSVTTMNNTAVMLQALKHYTDSRKWFEASLAVCEEIFGKTSANAATLSFQLAQALALDNDSKGSVNRMRDAYNIFLAELGPNDRNTKEAENWLEQLTQNAVALAKQAKETAARRRLLKPRVTMAAKPQPQVGQGSVSGGRIAESTTSATGIGSMDSRSIDELLKYIEGADTKANPKRTTGKANPKRRGASRK